MNTKIGDGADSKNVCPAKHDASIAKENTPPDLPQISTIFVERMVGDRSQTGVR